MRVVKRMLYAAMVLVPIPAGAAEQGDGIYASEVGVGLLAHGVRKPFRPAPPPLVLYAGEEERGTFDLALVYRSKPLRVALKPRLTARLQLNTGGRTSFAAVGAEWRQHILRGRIYGQVGIGLAIHDGYVNEVDPFAPGIGRDEASRRFAIYSRRTAFGSTLLLNPNISLGVRLSGRTAVELAFEHYSHNGWFGSRNPGIENIGVRLVHRLGR